jgi:glycosyltransferase involved in cell wall biosynthesis
MGCVGGLGDSDADRAYFRAVEGAAAGAPVELTTNAPRGRLRAELGRSRVFWHAMGLDAPAPHLEEHFGIATVEAMAAGCVPVVPARGGQPEIVTDGETGYLCREVGEYATRTAELAAHPARAARMAAAARDAAARFARPVFVGRMMSLISAACGDAPRRAAVGDAGLLPTGSQPA